MAEDEDPNAYFLKPYKNLHNFLWYNMREYSMFPEYEKETPKAVVMKGVYKTLVFGATVFIGLWTSYLAIKDDPAVEVKLDLLPEDINFGNIYTRTVEEGAFIVCQCDQYAINTSKVVDPSLPKDKYFRLHAVCQQGGHDQTLAFSTAEQFATSYAGGSLSRETFVDKEPFGCDEWKAEDFLSEEEFCQSIQWDTRHISFGELCTSADKFIGNQVSAYLETQLFSLELLTPQQIEELLRERFKQASNVAVSTFQLAYDLDTFRLDFEGVQTAWAGDLHNYLDRLHKNDILARLKAYEEHYDATLLVAFRDHVGDSPVPGEWWEESIATLWGMEVISDDFWFPYEVQTPLANVPFSWHTPINNDKCWDVDMDVTAAYCCFCAAQCQSDWVADGWCDPECNNPGCGYDGGDCCGDTCVSSFSDCGDNGYSCTDPGVIGSPPTEAPTSGASSSPASSSPASSSPASSSPASSSPAASPARRKLLNVAEGIDTKPHVHPTLRNLPLKLASGPNASAGPSKDRVQRSLAASECVADNGGGSDDAPVDDVAHGWESGLTPQWQVEGFETCWDANFARHGDVGYDSYNECCRTTRIAAREATPWPRKTVPTGNQLAEFSSAIFALQLYCTEQGFPMGHLYETTPGAAQDDIGDIVTALSAHHIKAWVKRIFEEWTWGNLDLRVPDTYTDEDGNLAHAEYGQGKASCLRVPSLANYVPAGCNCQKSPSCQTNSMHKFEFYVGRKQVTSTFDLETPMTLACSYFKQIDIFRNEQIVFRPDEMAGRSHHFNCSLDQSSISNLNSKTSVLSPSMEDYFATAADFNMELDTFDLRKEMKQALVQDWSDGVLSAPEIGTIGLGEPEAGALDFRSANFTYRLYYDQCAPSQCYEVVLEDPMNLTFYLAALAGFCQIGTFLATFSGGAAYQVFARIWKKPKKVYEVSKREASPKGSETKVHAIN